MSKRTVGIRDTAPMETRKCSLSRHVAAVVVAVVVVVVLGNNSSIPLRLYKETALAIRFTTREVVGRIA